MNKLCVLFLLDNLIVLLDKLDGECSIRVCWLYAVINLLNAFGAGTYNNKPEQMLLLHKF